MSPRLIHVATAALLVPVGLATKRYTGPGAAWVSDSVGGLLYVVFFVVLALAIRPRWSPAAVALTVLAITCTLEVLQRWHPAWLAPIRAHFLGHALLGSTFAWMDFPYYLAGALLGYVYGRAVPRRWGSPMDAPGKSSG
jgi:hypothetical protein